MNWYKEYTDYELNLMCAKHELKFQPFIKFLPQRDIFGGDADKDCDSLNDQSVYVNTMSGSEQKINFCEDYSQFYNILLEGEININFYEQEDGGFCTTDTSFFIDFQSKYELKRAVLIAYLVSKGLLPKYREEGL